MTPSDYAYSSSNQNQEPIIFKAVRHFRLQNERDVLLRFQHRTPSIRPLLDEIENPQALFLKYLDDDLLHASHTKGLNRLELKYVARHVLEALDRLHSDGFVHTGDIKPSTVLVNYVKDGMIRFKDVQVADFGSTVSQDSPYAPNGDPIGTPIFRSPEAHIQMRWGTATDIWSFGAMLISLMYGGGFHIFKPDVPADHDEYDIKILMKHHQCFGPFPISYEEIANQDQLAALTWVMDNCPKTTLKPFRFTTEREISREDRMFIYKIMKMDPRDRPSARELLTDAWLSEDYLVDSFLSSVYCPLPISPPPTQHRGPK
ncbi:hypothetical protein JX265_002986 [Neoarthrinium moseri]|uniref:Protein kinase domain-containing protein n=1 Tax=Neoarthrinium moseri TaxID=1658444 RepID=A0A9P9WTF5_9PEZI|nr:hypothetical protein JX265_002986 [Neoarthrinium moseri]